VARESGSRSAAKAEAAQRPNAQPGGPAARPAVSQKPTAERVLAAAEDLFARHGFDATSLADVAERVGIRTPSLYSHFASKQDLYEAVVDRLLEPFLRLHARFFSGDSTPERVGEYLGEVTAYHAAHPNLARLIQHASLAGGTQLDALSRRWRPVFDRGREIAARNPALMRRSPGSLPWIVIAFSSILIGNVTLAPLYRELFGLDPLDAAGVEAQTRLLDDLNRRLEGAGR
jgi:AcrR family transcriptional regulator